MGIEDAFLHDILAHPDDDAPRLIYADWLDEHNDPRGEFIRIQCALAQLSNEDPRRWSLERRQQELLREHEAKWLPKGVNNVECFFQRGFVEEIALSPETFLNEADRLFEQAPIRRLKLHLRGWERAELPDVPLAQVAPSRHLARLQSLSLTRRTVSRRELHEFLASPALGQLTELELSHLVVDNDESPRPGTHTLPVGILHDLGELPLRANLRALHLTDTGLSLDGLRFLANTSAFVSLRELSLSGNTLTHGAVEALAESRLLRQLELLNLDSILLGDAGALIMTDWPELPRLTRLSLRHNRIFSAGIQALAEAPALRRLLSLDLFGNIACDAGAIALASSRWTRLQALNLRFNGVGDKGLHALAGSETLSHLTWLNLTANRISSTGADSLIQSSTLSRLVRLDLLRNDIGTEARERLRDRFGPFVHFWPLAD